jgi:hypothetical protein
MRPAFAGGAVTGGRIGMKRVMFALVLGVVAAAAAVAPSHAEIAPRDLQVFEKGKSTYTEVTAKFGPPANRETNAEGLRAIVYGAASAGLGHGDIFALFGTVGGVFTPGAPKTADVNGAVAAFVFDRYGRLMYYRAVDGATAVTSEDGAGPMPNVRITLSPDQKQTNLPSDDGKPHLGIQLVPVSDLDGEHRKEFAAARFNGLVVANVIPGSPADKAGMASGDYLYALNGFLVASFADAAKAMATVNPGDTVVARVKRIDETAHLAREAVFNLKF